MLLSCCAIYATFQLGLTAYSEAKICATVLTEHTRMIRYADWTGNGHLVTAGWDGLIIVWDLCTVSLH
jgi:hypothetical protein